ncbi:hypothetical protein [Streptomyces sp. MAA16]|uniref:hypothetical protein n=1 Tax=Streptomyces sp. MAA16 TaxID=3035116 RepID=UPI00247533AC|nr:hypothetical protein [Streptomyces sp. MAA16]MDH6700369.1 hypothetical protein [Streptomyces sp. MAA16]
MGHDGQLKLHAAVADRSKEAHTPVRALQVPEGVRMALTRKLPVITAAAKHDPTDAAGRLERFSTGLDEGRFPPKGNVEDVTGSRNRCGTRVISPFRV